MGELLNFGRVFSENGRKSCCKFSKKIQNTATRLGLEQAPENDGENQQKFNMSAVSLASWKLSGIHHAQQNETITAIVFFL